MRAIEILKRVVNRLYELYSKAFDVVFDTIFKELYCMEMEPDISTSK